jgi:hypothetical protein
MIPTPGTVVGAAEKRLKVIGVDGLVNVVGVVTTIA